MTLDADKVYRFRVTAANSGGQSLPSEELACVWHPGGRQLLVVNGFHRLAGPAVKYNDMGMATGFDMEEDPGLSYGKTACWTSHLPFLAGNDFNYTTEHVRAMATMRKYSVVSCSSECLGMGDVMLSRYRLLDLILGNERNDGYSIKRYPSLPTRLKNELRYFNGALIVSGSYVGSDNQAPADSAFMAEVLYTDYQQKCYVQQQREIARINAFIENQRKWNRERNIIAVNSRLKYLDRMEKIDSGTVCRAFPSVNTSAKAKSFQIKRAQSSRECFSAVIRVTCPGEKFSLRFIAILSPILWNPSSEAGSGGSSRPRIPSAVP